MLGELPAEVLLNVARFLHADSVCLLRGVCQRLRDVLDDEHLFSQLACYYSRRGVAGLFDAPPTPELVLSASSRSEFVHNMTCYRQSCAPVFCFFFSSSELCFGNCLTGEMFVVPSHLTPPPTHASLDWVENGKTRDSAAALSAISLLFALAKEHRRFGVCAMVESSSFDRESFGRRDAFPQLSFHFESLPLLLGGFFGPECVVLILEDDRVHGWGVLDGAVGLRVCPPAAERGARGATELRRHVNGLKKADSPLRERHIAAAEELLVAFAKQHCDRRAVLVGGRSERLKQDLSIAQHEPQIFHCVFRALVAKAASIKYGRLPACG